MRTQAKKWFAMFLMALMLANMLPLSAFADQGPVFDLDTAVENELQRQTAFDVVQSAIDNNQLDAIPRVSAVAEATPRTEIATGKLFQYRINYTLGASPEYRREDGVNQTPAYRKYENIVFELTPPANVQLCNGDGSPLPTPYRYVIAESATSVYSEFTVMARMTDNGTSPNATQYGPLTMSMSADVRVKDEDLADSDSNPRLMTFTASDVPVYCENTTVTNRADMTWTVQKSLEQTTPVGDTVEFSYRIGAGRASAQTQEPLRLAGDYDLPGILTFADYTLTDTLPTVTDPQNNEVKPLSSQLVPLDASGNPVDARRVIGGKDQTTLTTSYYNTLPATGEAEGAGEIPYFTEYLVTAVYPRAAFQLPYGQDGLTIGLTNTADLQYTLAAQAGQGEASAKAAHAYQEITQAGTVTLVQRLLLAAGEKPEVDYDPFYQTVFQGPSEFTVYAAADVDENGQPIAGATPVETLTIPGQDGSHRASLKLGPGEYVVWQTRHPADTKACDPSWARFSIQSEQTQEIVFTNPVEGKGLLRFKKVTAAGKALQGATFTLYQNGQPTQLSATTGKDGTAFLLAPEGSYQLVETVVPANYVKEETPVSVTVESGKTTDLTAAPIVNYPNTATARISLYAVRYEKAGYAYADGERVPVCGVAGVNAQDFAFKLERALKADFSDGVEVKEYHIDATSGAILSDLPRTDGNGAFYYYRLTQSRCDDANLTVSSQEYVWQFLDSTNTNKSCDFYNVLRTGLQFAKKQYILSNNASSSRTEASAEGLRFLLYRQTGANAFEQVGQELTIDRNGLAQTAPLDICDADGNAIRYYLAEQNIGDNVVVYPQEATVNGAAAWGPVRLDGEWSKTAVKTSVPIVNELNKGQLLILTKEAVTNKNLAGAAYQVYYYENNDPSGLKQYLGGNANPTQYVSDGNGRILVDALATGLTYYIEQLQVPSNYYPSNPAQQTAAISKPLERATVTFVCDAKPKLLVSKKLLNPTTGSGIAIGDRAFGFEVYQKENDGTMTRVGGHVLMTAANVSQTATSNTVVLEEPGEYYLRETVTPSDVISPDVEHSGSAVTDAQGKVYFGPFTLQKNQTTTATVQNLLNSAKLVIEKANLKDANQRLEGAAYTLSAGIGADDESAAKALTAAGFAVGATGAYEKSARTGSNGQAVCDGLPAYGRNGAPIVYSVVETAAPTGYLLPDDNTPVQVTPAQSAKHTQTVAYRNAPMATLTVKKFLNRQWEINTNHSINYPLQGAVMELYLVENGALRYMATATTDVSGLCTFRELDGTKNYAVVERAVPQGKELPENLILPNAPEALDLQQESVLSQYNARRIDLAAVSNNAYIMSDADALMNYEPYAQFAVVKVDAQNPEKKLNHAKFKLYSCTVEAYAPYAQLPAREAFAALEKAGLLSVQDYVYETGTAKDAEGEFLTSSQTYGLVYWLMETQTPPGYDAADGGVVGPLLPSGVEPAAGQTYEKNKQTVVEVKNQAQQGGGGGEGSVRYGQVELEKHLYDAQGRYVKPLSNVTFELWLADAAFKPQALLSRFTTGLDTHSGGYADVAGRGISESFEFGQLYGLYSQYINRIDEGGYYNYEARFVLREVQYPVDVSPAKLEYPLVIRTGATAAGVTTTLDRTYTGENAIRNQHTRQVPVRIRKMGYNVANGFPTGEDDPNAKPLRGVTIGLFTDAACTKPYASAVTDQLGYANFITEPNRPYWYKELRTEGDYDFTAEIGSLVSPDYGKEQTESYVLYDPGYRVLTLEKADAAGTPWEGVTLRVTGISGEAITDANGEHTITDELTTGADGLTPSLALPNAPYRVEEIAIDGKQIDPVDALYFKLANAGGMPITFAAQEDQKLVRLVNPGKGSLNVTKRDDAGQPMANVAFAVEHKAFASVAELDPQVTQTDADQFTATETWITDENGRIEKTGLTPGWYRLTETVPEGYVGHQVASPVTVIKVTAVHLGATEEKTIEVELQNIRKGYLRIAKTYEQSAFAQIPDTLTFRIYRDAACTQSASPASVTLPILGGAGEAIVALDPGEYYVVEMNSSDWYAKSLTSIPGSGAGKEQWVNGPIRVELQSGHTQAVPVELAVRNVPSAARVTLLKTDDATPGNPVALTQFAVYYQNAEGQKLYYQRNGSWSADEAGRKHWETGADGRVEMTFTLPFDRLLASESDNLYWISEVYAPPSYVLAEDFSLPLGTGGNVDLTATPVVNGTGLYIDLTLYGRTRANAQAGDRLAGAELTLYLLKGGKAQAIATAVTAADGTLQFPNLPKLAAGEQYALAQTVTPDTHVDGSLDLYANGEQILPVTVGEQKLFAITQNTTIALDAYNTPKGSLAILKYNYLKPAVDKEVPLFAEFDIFRISAEGDIPVGKAVVSGYSVNDPQTLANGGVVKGTTYYEGRTDPYQGTLFTSSVTKGLEPGEYRVVETKPAQSFYYTPNSQPEDPWYPQRMVTVDDDGGVAVCYLANIPNPELPELDIDKTVIDVNGKGANGTLESLQEGWQRITYRISNFASFISKPIELKLKWLEVKDQHMSFEGVGGVPAEAEHYVETLTLGQARYTPTRLVPQPSTAPIFATVYGLNGEAKTKLATVEVSAGEQKIIFREDYKGFLIQYGTQPDGALAGLSEGFTAGPIEVQMRMRQSSGGEVVSAVRVGNAAEARMAYDIGMAESLESSWREAAVNTTVDRKEERPNARLELKAEKLNSDGMNATVQPGDQVRYTVTLTNVSPAGGPAMIDPVVIDRLSQLINFDIAGAQITAPAGLSYEQPARNGDYAYCVLKGELQPGQKIVMTIVGTVKYSTVTAPGGLVDNKAYALSTHLLHQNTENPTGTSFLDEKGALPIHDISGEVFGGESDHKALEAIVSQQLTQTTQLRLYKLVSANQSGTGQFYGPEQYALASAGGEIRYNIVLVNGGNSTVNNIRILDKLPNAGDRSVGSSNSRGSEWHAELEKVTGVSVNGKSTSQYTVYSTKTAESGLNYLDSLKGAQSSGIWTQGVMQDSAAVLVELDSSISLAPGEQLTISMLCTAPAAEQAQAGDLYFLLAVNDAISAATVQNTSTPSRLTSDAVKVILLPETVSLGSHLWLDVSGNGIRDAQSRLLSFANAPLLTLRSFANSETGFSSESARWNSESLCRFEDLSPAAINTKRYTPQAAYDSNGDILNSRLLGNARASYQLAVTGIPAGYLPTKAFADNGGRLPDYENNGVRDTDNNFKPKNGEIVSEKFYLRAGADDQTFDLGLIRVRDLTIEKTGTDGRAVDRAVFKVYGPFEDRQLYAPLTLSDDLCVATLTTVNGQATFTSLNADSFLNHYRNYVVVETDSSAACYDKNGLTATGASIAPASEHTEISGGGIEDKNYFILKAKQEGDTTISDRVEVTNTYTADGAMMLQGIKTLVGGEMQQGEFGFVLTSEGANADPAFRALYPSGWTVENDADGSFVFAVPYRYADAGMTYEYRLREENRAAEGLTYDSREYLITATVSDVGNGKLEVKTTYTMQGQPATELAFENVSRGVLRISKRVTGNAGDESKAFAFTVTLTDRGGQPVTGAFACTGSGAPQEGTLAFDATGTAALTLAHDQTVEISGLLTGTRYSIRENDYTSDGYVTTPVSQEASGAIGRAGEVNEALFINERNTGSLTIHNEIGGNAADPEKFFHFVIQLSRGDQLPVAGEYECEGITGTLTFDENGRAEIELKGGQSVTIKGILAGTEYIIEEDDYTEEAYVHTPASREASGTVPIGNAAERFLNVRNTGDITVRKSLAGNAAEADRAFSFTLTLLRDDHVRIAGEYSTVSTGSPAQGTLVVDENGRASFTLTGGNAMTIKGIPQGTSYTLTEADYQPEGYDEAAVLYSDERAPRKLAVEGAEITVVNTRNTYGALLVSKTVGGNAADETKPFDFTLELSRNDGLKVDGVYVAETIDRSTSPEIKAQLTLTVTNGRAAFTLKHNESIAIPGILTGTAYRVTEADYGVDGYETMPKNRTQSGTIRTERESELAAFVNVRNTGVLLVSNRVGGNAADAQKEFQYTLEFKRTDNAPYNGDYTCELSTNGAKTPITLTVEGGKAKFTLKHEQSLLIQGILKDTSYTVTQDGYALEGYQTQPVSRKYGGSILDCAKPYTADYLNIRNAGTLTVSKQLAGNATDGGKDFVFTVRLSRTDGVPVSGAYAYEHSRLGNGTLTVGVDGLCEVTLRGGETVRIPGILTGTEYRVTENDYRADGYTTTATGDAGTMGTGALTAAFVNTRSTGELTIRKTLGGNATEPERAFAFTVRVREPGGTAPNGAYPMTGAGANTVQFTNGVAHLSLRGGQSATISGLLDGSTYSVVETEANTEGYQTTATGATGVIRAQGAARAQFLNERGIEQAYGNLTVQKNWDDRNDRDELRLNAITVYLYADGAAIATAELSESNGWSHNFENLPLFTANSTRINYSVVEVAVQGYSASYAYGEGTASITNTHKPDRFAVLIEDGMVPLGGNINMNEGDCFN